MNLCSILANLAEFKIRLALLLPHVACVQETWLDDSVESINVKGYRLVSRRDRIDGCKSGFGGVVTLVREDVFNVVEIFKAENAERVSCTIHTNLGPVLLVN